MNFGITLSNRGIPVRLVVCAGGGAGPLWEAESAALNIAPGERRKRMIENIHVLRHLWTKDSQRLEAWLTYGSPRECVAHLKRFKAAGCRRITFRISTMGDPMAQFRRLVEDVLPYVD
jgi:alkanesulfonate monooxygenase SsuD/methylene tetrahydromethanopterin reductase-like flavin-dependent oxidoreductase (luciferase family)